MKPRQMSPAFGPAPQKSEIKASRMFLKAADLMDEGRSGGAAQLMRRALKLTPENPDLHYLLGLAYADMDRRGDAIDAWVRAVALNPEHDDSHHNLILSLMKTERWGEARAAAEDALARFPGDPRFLESLAHIHAKDNEPEKAFERYASAIELGTETAGLLYALGLAARDCNRHEKARDAFEAALALAPDFANAHFELSNIHFILGDYDRGFAEWEWRLIRSENPGRDFPVPHWNGRTGLSGKRLLVHGEQGAGDVVMFARFIPRLAARGARVTLACHEELAPLLEGVKGVERTVPLLSEPDDIDLHAPLFSLPYLLAAKAENIGSTPYIPLPDRPAPKPLDGQGYKVGIVWAGSSTHANNERRSTGLDKFLRLVRVEGVQVFSLQVGEYEPDLDAHPDSGIINLAPHLCDFADTAAALAELDLLIAVDTAVAHVAGALGTPFWVVLPYANEWRWGTAGAPAPWYPEARLFRQNRPGDWDECMERVAEALAVEARGAKG